MSVHRSFLKYFMVICSLSHPGTHNDNHISQWQHRSHRTATRRKRESVMSLTVRTRHTFVSVNFVRAKGFGAGNAGAFRIYLCTLVILQWSMCARALIIQWTFSALTFLGAFHSVRPLPFRRNGGFNGPTMNQRKLHLRRKFAAFAGRLHFCRPFLLSFSRSFCLSSFSCLLRISRNARRADRMNETGASRAMHALIMSVVCATRIVCSNSRISFIIHANLNGISLRMACMRHSTIDRT